MTKRVRRGERPNGRDLAEHFKPGGIPKRSFECMREAEVMARTIGGQVYRCAFCGDFHIGHRHQRHYRKRFSRREKVHAY